PPVPPHPPTLGAPRATRVAPLSTWGPDMAPKPPRSEPPGKPGALLCLHGGPDMAPKPPTFGAPRETRGAPLSTWGPRHGPQTPNLRSPPGNPGRSSIYFSVYSSRKTMV